jgi:hypothetical protein
VKEERRREGERGVKRERDERDGEGEMEHLGQAGVALCEAPVSAPVHAVHLSLRVREGRSDDMSSI